MPGRGSRLLSFLRAFLEESRRYLVAEYPAKIHRAVDPLSPEQVWWRANDASNSVGNLVLHLAGNVRQWVVHGLGGRPDVRHRAGEFDRRGGMDGPGLLDHLHRTVADVDTVLAGMDPGHLGRRLEIQGLETDGFQALYHAVEHFSMHTGQILCLAKQITGRDLGFYQVDDQGRVTGTRW